MSAQSVRWSVVVPWALTAVMVAAIVAAAAGTARLPEFGADAQLLAIFGLVGVWGLANATVGAVIVSRRPGNRVGRILQLGGPLVIGVFLGNMVSAIRSVTAGPGDLLGAFGGWWASVSFFPAVLVAFPLVAIMYPDGRLPGPRWRGLVTLVTVGVVAISGIHAIAVGPVGPDLPSNPFGVLRLPRGIQDVLDGLGALLLVLSLGLAFAAISVRWRRGDRLARAQLKWLLGALALCAVFFPLSFAEGDGHANVFDVLAPASATLVPIAIAIAVLRYRLYEIDRIISRTLSYGALTVVLVGVYLAGFALLQAVLVPFTRGGGSIAVAASTLVVFALFQPLRGRLRAMMDRRFNRSRYDAQRTVEGFAAGLRDEFDLERLGGELGAVVGQALAPTSVGLWLRPSLRIPGA